MRVSASVRIPYVLLLAILAAASITFACDRSSPGAVTENSGGATMDFVLQTDAFQPNGKIPTPYTCSGTDTSPHLTWTGTPPHTLSLALIVEDPDAPGGTFTHWVLYNLPPQTTELRENFPRSEQLPDGSRQGRNDFVRIGYSGPCPPPGKAHRYFFRLYALDQTLTVPPGATKEEVERAMKGHVLGEARLMGSYQR